jgi:DNA-binding response OmpR family regulator
LRNESWPSNLNILAEDVDVKIRNLRKEENLVQKAGEYISELKFLVSEIDKKKESLG